MFLPAYVSCCCSVPKLYLTLCDPMDCSMPGFSNSCPLSRWCQPTISFSVALFSSHSQSFPASGTWVSSSHLVAKVMELWLQLPMNIQGWFPLGLTALIYLPSKTLSSCLLQHQNSKASILQCSAFLLVQLSYPYMTNGKKHSLHYTEICWQSDVSAF